MSAEKKEYEAPVCETIWVCIENRILDSSTEDYVQDPFDPFDE